jgi:hypothetical protein
VRRRTLLGIGGVLSLAGLALGAFAMFHHPSHHSELSLRREGTLDVSKAPGPQSEVAVAADPERASILVAGSNDIGARLMRAYGSRDGGRTWSSAHISRPRSRDVCETSDPGVAIGPGGTQYFTFLGIHCVNHRARGTSIYIARRDPARPRWRTLELPVSSGRGTTLADDRPSVAVDNGASSPHRGRVYVAWSRFSFDPSSLWVDPDQEQVSNVQVSALVSHSDDRGRHWSRPTVVSQHGTPLEVRLAVARDGKTYAAWRDAQTNTIYLSLSNDGATFGEPRFVAAAVVEKEHSCHTFRARIAAQPKRCVSPNPVVAVDDSTGPRTGRVYLVWGSTALNQSQDIEVAAFTPELDPVLGVGRVQQVNRPEDLGGPDQFLPTAAVDPLAGRLWACYYQTVSAHRTKARFMCTASDDGGRAWTTPVSAGASASDESRRPANVGNGYGDYEGAAVAGGKLIATWTDGSMLATRGEEIFSARITAGEARGR